VAGIKKSNRVMEAERVFRDVAGAMAALGFIPDKKTRSTFRLTGAMNYPFFVRFMVDKSGLLSLEVKHTEAIHSIPWVQPKALKNLTDLLSSLAHRALSDSERFETAAGILEECGGQVDSGYFGNKPQTFRRAYVFKTIHGQFNMVVGASGVLGKMRCTIWDPIGEMHLVGRNREAELEKFGNMIYNPDPLFYPDQKERERRIQILRTLMMLVLEEIRFPNVRETTTATELFIECDVESKTVHFEFGSEGLDNYALDWAFVGEDGELQEDYETHMVYPWTEDQGVLREDIQIYVYQAIAKAASRA
jgi:hypothetical protein